MTIMDGRLDPVVTHRGHPEFRRMTEEELKLHDEKNADYAGQGDALGNFHRVANMLGNYPKLKLSDPDVVALVYAFKQLDAALWQISNGYEGKVENVDTRLRDCHVYFKLARILHGERSIPKRILELMRQFGQEGIDKAP